MNWVTWDLETGEYVPVESKFCGECAHIREHHHVDDTGEPRCDQCLVLKPVNTDFYHRWEEFNPLGNRVWGQVV